MPGSFAPELEEPGDPVERVQPDLRGGDREETRTPLEYLDESDESSPDPEAALRHEKENLPRRRARRKIPLNPKERVLTLATGGMPTYLEMISRPEIQQQILYGYSRKAAGRAVENKDGPSVPIDGATELLEQENEGRTSPEPDTGDERRASRKERRRIKRMEFERDTQEILEHLKEKRQSDLVTAEEERGKSWKHKNECRYQSRSKREKGSRTDAMKPIAQITDESALGQALKRISKLNDSDPSDSSSDSSWDDCSSDADTSDSSDSNSSSSDRTSSSSSDNASRGGGQKKKVDRHKLRKSSRKSNRSRKNRKSKNPEAAIVSSLPFHHPMTEP
ncbi:hypothetical protein C0989_009219, partial [Termitomyces sp. Mn162]